MAIPAVWDLLRGGGGAAAAAAAVVVEDGCDAVLLSLTPAGTVGEGIGFSLPAGNPVETGASSLADVPEGWFGPSDGPTEPLLGLGVPDWTTLGPVVDAEVILSEVGMGIIGAWVSSFVILVGSGWAVSVVTGNCPNVAEPTKPDEISVALVSPEMPVVDPKVGGRVEGKPVIAVIEIERVSLAGMLIGVGTSV
jgi:hypothetical protein